MENMNESNIQVTMDDVETTVTVERLPDLEPGDIIIQDSETDNHYSEIGVGVIAGAFAIGTAVGVGATKLAQKIAPKIKGWWHDKKEKKALKKNAKALEEAAAKQAQVVEEKTKAIENQEESFRSGKSGNT